METLATLFFGFLLILAIVVAGWILITTLKGAAEMFETAGPIVLLGWILVFPLMLVISFLWALSNSFEAANKAREYRSIVDTKKRDRELANKNIVDKWLEKVIAYEAETPINLRTKYDFSRFMNNSYDFHDISSPQPAWLSQSHIELRNLFLDALEYPEASREELQSAVLQARTEKDFKDSHPRLLSFFGQDYPENPQWILNENADEMKRQQQLEEQKRKAELRSRMDLGH